nr:polymorphic toxin type 24 domain-containing protein [Leptospira wolffii]
MNSLKANPGREIISAVPGGSQALHSYDTVNRIAKADSPLDETFRVAGETGAEAAIGYATGKTAQGVAGVAGRVAKNATSGLKGRTPANQLEKNISTNVESKGTKKSRNKPPPPDPKAQGRAHSIIERYGRSGQYTTHNGDGTWKQYRGSGKEHGQIKRPNIKEAGRNRTPDGREFIDKGRVRIPRNDEYPGK